MKSMEVIEIDPFQEIIFKNFAVFMTVIEKHYITMKKGGIEENRYSF